MKELTTLMAMGDVAISFGVDERTVRKYAYKIFPNKIKNGVKTYFNEEEVTRIKFELQKNQHLGSSPELPKTNLEKKLLIQQAIGFLNEEIEDLKQKVEHQTKQLEKAQPKIDFHDQVETSVNSISVAEFANLLTKNGFKTGQNKLFKWFYDNRYLITSDRPYQLYINAGLFEVKKLTYPDKSGKERTAHKVLITGKGQTYFTKKLTKSNKLDKTPVMK